MSKAKMIILADLGALKLSCEGFKEIVKGLEVKFDVVACKFYDYVAKRNRDFNEYIAANGYDTSLPSASRRRNRLDSRQIMDATTIAYDGTIQAVGFITGEGDILPILNLLKSKGIDVYDINIAEGKWQYAYNGFYQVPMSALRKGYAAPPSRVQKAKKATKPVEPKKAEAPKPSVNKYIADAQSILAGNEFLKK
ncbi:MAG: NYN domain-containing protein [Christensenellales bacterium]|jgi:hypothetical protein|nr:NYN domain-containing protein [Clostridiales bacterium]